MLTLLLILILSAPRAQTPAIRWEPYEVRAGSELLAAELGRLTVPERHSRPAGRQIEIAFVRLRTTAPAPGSPVVYLDGGPGGSGVATLRIPEYLEMFRALQRQRDVIIPSQRGVGLSRPVLACPSSGTAPDDVLTSDARMAAVTFPRIRECARTWREQGAEIGAYNTEESADDLNAIRVALGRDHISILGFSYGTHLGLSLLRRHPAAIDRAALLGVEGPDHTWKLPHTFDVQTKKIGALVAMDADARTWMPDFDAALRELLRRAAQTPLRVPIGTGAAARTLSIGRDGLRFLLRRDIGDSTDIPWMPKLVAETLNGRHDELARIAARRLPIFEGGVQLMPFAMDCASGAGADRLAQIAREQDASVLGTATNAPFPAVCDAIGVMPLGDAYRAPIFSLVPTLFISGSLDSNTPPYQAEEVRWGFPNSTHLIVENAGHESTTAVPEIRRAIVEFLLGSAIAPQRYALPPPKFISPAK